MNPFFFQIRWMLLILCLATGMLPGLRGAERHESFDRRPASWVGVNHRNAHFPERTVRQDFGFSPATVHAGGQPGEIGGRIQPAGEPAWYAWPLPEPLTLEQPLQAEGLLKVARGGGNFLFGFFNAGTVHEWRTPNALVARINGRGETFHAHFEYGTSRWRAGAGVIGTIVPGERIEAREMPSGQSYAWKLAYDPEAAQGRGEIRFSLNDATASCVLDDGHRQDGARFTHFGLLPVAKTWDDAGEVWLDNLKVNGTGFEFNTDPGWEGFGNRRTHITGDTRPRFDFGWSPTHHAGGVQVGELGGLIFRGDCREPARMACYGDPVEPLSLQTVIRARGRIAMTRGVTDSTASIGFYHSRWSMESNPSQSQSVPRDYLGINIEGPSSEGFFFYPVYRTHGDVAGAWSRQAGPPLRIYPDGKAHDWFLEYDPHALNGTGRITVGLDGQLCTLDLQPDAKASGAIFDRFGICTPWIDGNSVTVFFDDLTYTCAP